MLLVIKPLATAANYAVITMLLHQLLFNKYGYGYNNTRPMLSKLLRLFFVNVQVTAIFTVTLLCYYFLVTLLRL